MIKLVNELRRANSKLALPNSPFQVKCWIGSSRSKSVRWTIPLEIRASFYQRKADFGRHLSSFVKFRRSQSIARYLNSARWFP